MEFLERITITCFAASYTITLALELTRFFLRFPIRAAAILALTVAGLVAHTVYLFAQSRIDLLSGVPLSSWYSWCLVGAWLLVVIYLVIRLRQPKTPAGLLLLPLALGLVAAAWLLQDVGAFSAAEARNVWYLLHGISLLAGTVAVSAGFVAGVLYLIESYRLKHKMGPERRFTFPSLERLQLMNERSLIVSSALLGLGVVSGIVINLINQDEPSQVQWTDPVIWTSGGLFLWLVAAVIFNVCYKPARHGRKVAYLVVASFVFLVLSLIVAFSVQHGGQPTDSSAAASHESEAAR